MVNTMPLIQEVHPRRIAAAEATRRDEKGEHDALEQEGHPDRGDERSEPRGVAQPTVRETFDCNSGEARGDHRQGEEDGDRRDEAGDAVLRRQPVDGQVQVIRPGNDSDGVERTERKDIAVCEVDQLDDSIDHRVPDGDQRIDGAHLQSSQDLIAGLGAAVLRH